MDKEQEPSQVELADYTTQPKNAPTGAGTLNPIVEGLRSGTLKMQQVLQAVSPRGYPTDINSTIFTEPLTMDPLPSMSRMNHGRLFEQVVQAEAEASDSIAYIPADGAPRYIPNRSMGESETRMRLSMPPLDRSQQPRPVTIDRMMKTQGYARNVGSNVFSHLTAPNADFDGNALMVSPNYLTLLEKVGQDWTETSAAGKSLVHTATPLNETEYANRKLKYSGRVDEELETPEAERLRRKEERRLERIQRKVDAGQDRSDATRVVDYNTAEGRRLREEFKPPVTMTVTEAIAKLLAERPEGWEAQIKQLQTQQEGVQSALARGIAKDQAKRKQVLLAEGYSEADAEWMKVYSKVEWHNLQIEWHLLRQQYHKAQLPRLLKAGHKQVDAIRIAAQIAERYTDGNPNDWPIAPELNWQLADLDVPPPPVLDFSTGDLELPERFIIKDLDGFKFDPETQFDGLRLPYDSCLFVLGQEPERAVVLATQEDEDVITLKLLSEQKSELPWHADATLYVRLNGSKARLKWANTRRALDKRLGMVSSVLGFLAGEQLNELEIETVITAPEGRDIPPPKPGWCYNVVHLTQGKKGKRKDWQGGTHASPREHKRKGYWWPGRKGPIWIKATIVNKGVLGRVDKEYHVTKLIEQTNET